MFMEQDTQILATQSGPALLGCFMDWALLGVLNVQVYLYHVNVSCDPLFLQILVYVVFILEWLQSINLTSMAWQVFVVDYGQGDALSTIHVGWMPLPILCSVISLITQLFFAWRICMLSKSTRIVSGIILLALVQTVCGFLVGIKLKDGSASSQFLSSKATLIVTSLWMAGSAFVDILIAVVMTILMIKRKTGIAATDRIINKIIRLVVETGSLTASVATVGLILAILAPEAAYYQPPIYTLTKLYSNTFLTNLTNRFFLGRDHLPRGQHHRSGTDVTSLAFTSVFPDVEDFHQPERSAAQGEVATSAAERIQRSLGLDRQTTGPTH
ncbi:uncharacterized protein C8Q71DRAFT_574976 [Rhodofomes roseus]|uniref:DUF6534 domain-containing protein n=1 Tax=Rhodofomes roseus TaxID=34475 RepID=A0ABQ8KJ93_9APHY|nr:uncharacterized protein C8Q71DRAFT_574976 [Rhodofomes roseus]KAH9838039.1 hypothetical protein C8Q71DRAFT_574976 [Rhodofomes roseus]